MNRDFAGVGLTALLLVSMLLRHLNATLLYTLFCFGYERRLALTSVADGLVGLWSMVLLVPVLGLYGAVLGSLVSIALVSLPAEPAGAGARGRRFAGGVPEPLAPWLMRFVPLVGGSRRAHRPCGRRQVFWTFAPFAVAVGARLRRGDAARDHNRRRSVRCWRARLQPWLSRVPRLARHLVEPADALAR